MTITLYNTSSETNRVTKKLTNEINLSGTLRERTNVINPSILIEYNGNITSNYCYISEFGRYYFINNITYEGNKLFRLDLSVDVLMSYRSDILKQTCIVKRNQNSWNLYIPDNSFGNLSYLMTQTKTFPNGFSNIGEYILVVAGS